MKKYLSTLVVLLILILTLSACSSSSNDVSQQDAQTQTENAESSNSTATDTVTDLIGDWQFEGIVNDTTDYDINLDLESNGNFELNVEDNTQDDLTESEIQGTYEATNDMITFNTVTVNDQNKYFNPNVVADSIVDVNYTLDGNTLTLKNASDVLSILPNDFTLTKDQ